jgi:hypothetical protein
MVSSRRAFIATALAGLGGGAYWLILTRGTRRRVKTSRLATACPSHRQGARVRFGGKGDRLGAYRRNGREGLDL